MSETEHDRVVAAFERVIRAPADRQDAVLADACADDEPLRAEIEVLLKHHRAAGGFLEPPRVPEHPAHIGSYRIGGVLGEGAMGIVYRAEQSHPRREVAVKVLHPHTMTARSHHRFEFEAETLGRLDHPGIARIFEAGTLPSNGSSRPFFAMELVDGRPITTYAEEEGLDLDARLDLVARVCDAAQHAHQKGVIHRDLKPANVLVDSEGRPRVLDFGIARLLDDGRATHDRTKAGALVGTLPYMSPEQIDGDPDEVDTRSDVYALGVLLFEVLTGHRPHELPEGSVVAQARAIVETPPTRLGSIDRTLRGDPEWIVARALEKSPERRYATAADLAADIRRYLAGEPIVARPPSVGYVLARFTARHRGLVTGIVIAVMTLVAMTVLVFTLLSLARQESDRNARVLLEVLDQAGRGFPEGARIDELRREVTLIRDPQLRSAALDAMARALSRLGEPQEAERTIDEASEAASEVIAGATGSGAVSEAQRSAMRIAHTRALLMQEQERFREAEEGFRALLAEQNTALGPHDPETLTTRNSLAVLLDLVGRPDEALQLHEETMDLWRRRDGWRREPAALTALNTYGTILYHLDRIDESIEALDSAVTLRRTLLGPTADETLSAAGNLAAVLARHGRYSQAERVMRDVHAAQAASMGADASDTLNTLNNLAWVLLQQDRPADAIVITGDLVTRLDDNLPHMVVLRGVARIQHGNALAGVGRKAEAKTVLLEAIDLLERAVGPDHQHTRKARASLGAVSGEAGPDD